MLIYGIIKDTSRYKDPIDEVTITPNAKWSVVSSFNNTVEIKKEHDDSTGPSVKRCRTDDFQPTSTSGDQK